jgi:hypothetical protein
MTSDTPDPAALFGQIDICLFDQLLRRHLVPGMRVLDAGCGSGRNLVYLLRAGYDVCAVDADPVASNGTTSRERHSVRAVKREVERHRSGRCAARVGGSSRAGHRHCSIRLREQVEPDGRLPQKREDDQHGGNGVKGAAGDSTSARCAPDGDEPSNAIRQAEHGADDAGKRAAVGQGTQQVRAAEDEAAAADQREDRDGVNLFGDGCGCRHGGRKGRAGRANAGAGFQLGHTVAEVLECPGKVGDALLELGDTLVHGLRAGPESGALIWSGCCAHLSAIRARKQGGADKGPMSDVRRSEESGDQ